jgi:hypothetical protein
MEIGSRAWRALLVLSISGTAAYGADQCAVSELAIGVPDGPAKYLTGGPIALAQPQVKVTPPSSGPKPVRRPPRPVPKNDQERLFAAVFAGELAAVERLLHSGAIDVNAPARSDLRRSLIDVAAMTAQPQIATALIQHGARVRDPVDAVDVRPIGMAILTLQTTVQMHGNPAAFAWSPERSTRDFEDTIRVLLGAGDMRIARLLLDHGAQLDPRGQPSPVLMRRGMSTGFRASLARASAYFSKRRSDCPAGVWSSDFDTVPS